MMAFPLEIITPEGKLFSGECLQVDVPGSEGRMGILAHHMNFVSSLMPGLVEIYLKDNSHQKLVVADGIIEINSGKCVLLVEQANDLKNLKSDDLQNQIGHVKHNLEKADSKALKHALETELNYLEELFKQIRH